jgi:alkaline phosphatase D
MLIAHAQPPDPDTVITRILFGSCVKQQQPTPIFQTMASTPADLLLFLGDNIYADTEDMAEMRVEYERLAANPSFDRLRNAIPILATWDDHDFGGNDAGADYPMREQSQKEYLDFWRVPEDSPRRKQAGVYNAHWFGPDGKRVQVIMLDTRYFRSALKHGERRVGGKYYPDDDPSKTMLGDKQWQWFEQQLLFPADLRIIATSIQCIPEAAGQETWANLPRERQRLFELIASTKASGVVLVSGDRHWSELSRLVDQVPYPIYEMTSSSFNQIHPRGTPTTNRYRANDATYHRENYGVITIDWDVDDPAVTMQIRDMEAGVRIEQKLRLSQLR